MQPIYLTKEERTQLAIEARQREVEQKRKAQQEALARQRSSPNSDGEIEEETYDPNELKAIKSRFLGTEEKKKKIKSDKKFNFDWGQEDDTSKGEAVVSSILFGKGRIGGFEKSDLVDSGSKKREKSDRTHWSDKKLEEMEERDWRILKEDFNISTKGGSVPHPIRSWNESELADDLISTIKRIGYKEPTPIQRQAIPIALKNRDLIGVAETGSGKTAAFVLPMLMYIRDLPRMSEETMLDGPYAIIMAPTRELALQIEDECKKFAKPLGFHCISLVGGHSLSEQSFSLRNGAEIVIATPGRLRDCIDRHIIVLNQCSYIVLDEADRMLDMGFEADLNYILESLPTSNMKPDNEVAENPLSYYKHRLRQTIMFSATMLPEVEKLARKYLRKPAVIYVGNAGQAVSTVEQRVEIMSEERKKIRLIEILEAEGEGSVIIFANQKQKVDLVHRFLEKEGFKAIVLHGGKSQDQREIAIDQLKTGKRDILVATDVAGRGLDIKDVSVVINFDMAKSIQDYTHRIGRTGRAGRSGLAITFLTAADSDLFYDLKQMMLKSPVSKVPAELMNHEAANRKPGLKKNEMIVK